MIDADPQSNLTSSLGIDNADELENTLGSFIEREINEKAIDPSEYILHNDEGVDIMPCNIKLAGMDYMIMNALSREHLLDAFVSQVRDLYDYILIDCSPSLNLVTINVLTAVDSVIIPVEASYLSMAGLQQLLGSIGSTKRKLNRKLEVEGIVINKVNTRTNHEKDIIEKPDFSKIGDEELVTYYDSLLNTTAGDFSRKYSLPSFPSSSNNGRTEKSLLSRVFYNNRHKAKTELVRRGLINKNPADDAINM